MKPEVFYISAINSAKEIWDTYGDHLNLDDIARTNIQHFFESVGLSSDILAERAIEVESSIRRFNSNLSSGDIGNAENNGLELAKVLDDDGYRLPLLPELPADERTIKLFTLGFLRQIQKKNYRFSENVSNAEQFATATLVDRYGLAVTEMLNISYTKPRMTDKTPDHIVGAVLENVSRSSAVETDAFSMEWYTEVWGFSTLFLLDRFASEVEM